MERDHANAKEESNNSSPRKLLGGGSSGGCDRLKRDEWSEGAVSSLLEAYESKWVLRNRAKLKGQDWEDVARHVSSRANSTKSPKTQTQCKNKIESMKKRYRSESAAAAGDHCSSWPLFSRLDHLMHGTGGGGGGVNAPPPPAPTSIITNSPPDVGPAKSTTPLVLLESLPPAAPQPPPPPPAPPPPPPPPPQPCFLTVETAQSSPKSNGGERIEKEERVLGGEEAKLSSDHGSDDHNKNTMAMDTDSSTPALYGSKDTTRSKPNNNNNSNRIKKAGDKRKRRRVSSSREDMDSGIAQSIQLLAEAVVRSEQARMETMRELERMRVEAEARRAEMDLKRTEIIANTQLEIARIFAACSNSNSGGKSVDSSPGIAKNCI